MGMIARAVEAYKSRNQAPSNASIVKGQGLELNTILTPKGKRKKPAGLRGGDTEELIPTVLGG
jgi:hypothetical protein